MKLRIWMASLACGLFVASASQAAEYYITTLDQTSMDAIDIRSISRTGDIATAWVVNFLPKPTSNPRMPATDFIATHNEYDCQQKQMRRKSLTLYDLEGKVLVEGPSPEVAWRPVQDGSRGATTFKAVCFPETRTKQTRDAELSNMAKSYRAWITSQTPSSAP